MDEIELLMQNQKVKDVSITKESGSIDDFKIDKDKIKRELEAEIKESIDLDPIVNEINLSSDRNLENEDIEFLMIVHLMIKISF